MTARKLCPCSHNDCWKQRASTSSTIQESRLPTQLSLPGEVKPILVKHQASQERRLSAVTARKMVTQKIAAGKSRKENQEKPHHHQLKPALPKPAANPCGQITTLSHFIILSFSFLSISNRNINDWYVDSGASQHMSDQRWMFSSFYPVHPGSWPVKGIGSDADPLQAAGFGDIHVRVRVNEEWHDGVFSKVLFVPNLGANLFSVGAAASRGVIVSFVGEKVIIARGRKTIAVGASRNRKLYILDAVSKGSGPRLTQAPAISLLSRTVAEPVDLWHHRLGHVYSAVI